MVMTWLRLVVVAAVMAAFTFPPLVECRIRHYKFNVGTSCKFSMYKAHCVINFLKLYVLIIYAGGDEEHNKIVRK